MPCVTLLTDFGLSDEYVAVMKGTILSFDPNATIVDITHQVEPQDIVQAAGLIRSAYRYFPAGTIHVVVVDPGVGTDRPVLAAEGRDYRFVSPDNGILFPLWETGVIQHVHRVENSDYFLKEVSRTFHGRDIFAPVAGHWSAGLSIERLGPAMHPDEMAHLEMPKPIFPSSDELEGRVVSIDHFGNIITNIDVEALNTIGAVERPESVTIRIGNHRIEGLSPNYEGAGFQKALAIIGSRGYLEIALYRGHAFRALGIGKRECVRISRTDKSRRRG